MIRGGGYGPWVCGFKLGDYVYLKQITSTTLDVITGCVILHVQEVLPFGILLLEGRDGQTWKNHVCNCVPCHLPNVNGQIDPSLVVIPIGLRCMLCGLFTGTTTMLVYDWCSRRWHMVCLTPPLD
ncbi:hypothetical protein BDL97_08G034600 [Sphagnum fallax]|jgi:hypothetical protein|nr:hypothetical protein BDL97_08G034600 [Sphagnum fallax]